MVMKKGNVVVILIMVRMTSILSENEMFQGKAHLSHSTERLRMAIFSQWVLQVGVSVNSCLGMWGAAADPG